MKDSLLKATVGVQLAGQRAIARAQDAFEGRKESGDIVQTIIIIAMFVLICVVVGGILIAAIRGQATSVGKCIASANSGKCSSFG